MSEKHDLSGSGEEQDVEAHAGRTSDVEEQIEPTDDEDVQAHIKFN